MIAVEVQYKDIKTSPRLMGKAIKKGVYYMPYGGDTTKPFKKPYSLDLVINTSRETAIDINSFTTLPRDIDIVYWPETITVSNLKANTDGKSFVVSWNSKNLLMLAIVINNVKITDFSRVINFFEYDKGTYSENYKNLDLSYNIVNNNGVYEYKVTVENNGDGQFKWPEDVTLPFEFKIFMYEERAPAQEKWLSINVNN